MASPIEISASAPKVHMYVSNFKTGILANGSGAANSPRALHSTSLRNKTTCWHNQQAGIEHKMSENITFSNGFPLNAAEKE